MNFVLAELNENTPVIKDIKKYLKQFTGQVVTSVNTSERLKKVAGEPTKNIYFYLAGGQIVEFLFRKNGDIVKVKINKKEHPTAGHLIYDEKSIFKTAIEEISQKIKKTQRAFEERKARADKKTASEVGSTATHKDGKDAGNVKQKVTIASLTELQAELDEKITQKESQLSLLKQEYDQLIKAR